MRIAFRWVGFRRRNRYGRAVVHYALSGTCPTIQLGETGIEVSRLCIGTGTNGWGGASDQTRLGMKLLPELLCAGVALGANFWDLADQYGSHPHAARALQTLDRERVVVMTKTCSTSHRACVRDLLRYQRELETEYIDVVLLHCVQSSEWPDQWAGAMRAMAEAKEQGLVRAVGVSVHDLDALETAASHEWVDVLLVRLNYAGTRMDGEVEEVLPLIRHALDAGKGVVGMKALGCGELASDPVRALRWVFQTKAVQSIALGLTELPQLRQALGVVSGLEHAQGG